MLGNQTTGRFGAEVLLQQEEVGVDGNKDELLKMLLAVVSVWLWLISDR